MSTVQCITIVTAVLYKDEEDLKTKLLKANQRISKQQEIIDDLMQSLGEGMSLYGMVP